MRYWISRTEGNVEGPFEESELQNMLAEGSINLETQVCPENTESWQTLDSVPGFGSGGAGADLTEVGFTRTSQPSRYNFNAAFSLGWQVFTQRYGIVLGVTLFAILASFIPNFCTIPVALIVANQAAQGGGGSDVTVLQLFSNCFAYAWGFFVTTPISIGAVWVIIRILRGHGDASFQDIWTPFKRYGWMLLGILLTYVCSIGIAIVAGIIGGIPGTLIGVLISYAAGDPAAGIILGSLVGGLIFLIIAYYLFVRISMMLVLIIDPEAGMPNPVDALVSSWKRTAPCAWSLLGLAIVLTLISTASFFACFLPLLFFGYPLFIAVIAGAYNLLVPTSSKLHCRSCGYTRAPGAKGNCPECGAPWDVEEVLA